ncbi:MAG: hypothetical protein IJ934_03570 [Acetobacter sp.]|nr:hypothetical protein [Acetobacter sp.]
MSFGSVSITPIIRLFLPLTVIPAQFGHQAVHLNFNNVRVRWNILHNGFNAPIILSADAITLKVITSKISTNKGLTSDKPTEHIYDSLQSLTLTLEPHALLHGVLSPRKITIHQAHLALVRTQNNTIGLDFGQTSDAPSQNNIPLSLNAIEQVTLNNACLTIRDSSHKTYWTIAPLNIHLNLDKIGTQKGLIGSISATLTENNDPNHTLRLTAHGVFLHALQKVKDSASLRINSNTSNTKQSLSSSSQSVPLQKEVPFVPSKNNNGILWHVEITPFNPASLAHIIPSLSFFDAPLTFSTDVWFAQNVLPSQKTLISKTNSGKTPWLLPQTILLHTDLGSGHIRVAGSTFETDHGHLTLTFQNTLQGTSPSSLAQFKLSNTAIILRHPDYPTDTQHQLTLNLNGWLQATNFLAPSTIKGALTADIPQVAFQDLNQYWPSQAAKGGKIWVTKNITSGMASHLYTQIRFESPKGWKQLKISGLDGSVDAKGLTVHWLRPITPLKNMNARLEIHNLHMLTIDFDGGYQPVGHHGRIQAGPGRMTINHLERKIPTGTIVSNLEGTLNTVLQLLKEPRLHLFTHRKIGLTNPRGNAKIAFKISLPLANNVKNDDIFLNVHADITHAALDNIVAGRSITNGNFSLDTDTSKLSLTGEGTIANIPAHISYSANLHHVGPQEVLEQAHVTSSLTPAALKLAGYNTYNHFYGNTNLTVNYRQMGNHTGTVNLAFNLTPSLIDLPLWHKNIGEPAKASALLELTQGHLTAIQNLTVSGPKLSLLGNAKIDPNKAFELFISSFQINDSIGQAHLTIPPSSSEESAKKPYNAVYVDIQANRLDLSSLVSHSLTDTKSNKETQYTSNTPQNMANMTWIVNITAHDLLFSKNKPSLHEVTASFEESKHHFEKLRFSMQEPTVVQVNLTSLQKKRVLTADIRDVGHFLDVFNILPDIKGGHALITGDFDDTKPLDPFHGKITVSSFVLDKAPTALRIMHNVSLPNWITAQNPSNLKITYLTIPLTFENGKINIHDARTGNTALGATIEGVINIVQHNINLQGTVAPLFTLNKLPGKLPGVGWLFSPEAGSGLLAFTFSVTGNLKNPIVHINPFSILLPGMLRQIF